VLQPVVFHLRAKEEIRALPRDVRVKLGSALLALQRGFNLGLPVSEIELARRRLTEMLHEYEQDRHST
jgi:phage-related protein